LEAEDYLDEIALMKATMNGQLVAVENLIDAGVNVNVQDKYSETALTKAAHDGHDVVS
jgi:ankyrin repeat protein